KTAPPSRIPSPASARSPADHGFSLHSRSRVALPAKSGRPRTPQAAVTAGTPCGVAQRTGTTTTGCSESSAGNQAGIAATANASGRNSLCDGSPQCLGAQATTAPGAIAPTGNRDYGAEIAFPAAAP